MTTRPSDEPNSEKLLRDTQRITAVLLATVSELEVFAMALSAQNKERAERPSGEDPE